MCVFNTDDMANYDIIVHADLLNYETNRSFLDDYPDVLRRIEEVRRAGNVVLDLSVTDEEGHIDRTRNYIAATKPPKDSIFTLYGVSADLCLNDVASILKENGYAVVYDAQGTIL